MAEFKFGRGSGSWLDWQSVTDLRSGQLLGLVRRDPARRGQWQWVSAGAPEHGNAGTRLGAAAELRASRAKPKRGRPPLDPGGAMVRLEIRLPKALRVWAEAEAQARGRTVSELIRKLLEDERDAR